MRRGAQASRQHQSVHKFNAIDKGIQALKRTGLLGETNAIALVFEVMRDLHRSTEGVKFSSGKVCSGTGSMPNKVKSILHID